MDLKLKQAKYRDNRMCIPKVVYMNILSKMNDKFIKLHLGFTI